MPLPGAWLVGRLHVKARVARELGRARGWQAATRVPAIVVAEGRTARRRVVTHASLFAAYPVRGRRAMAWLRRPGGPIPPGLLVMLSIEP